MPHTREALPQRLAERLPGEAARRDDARMARRLYRQPVIDGGDRLDDGAGLEALFDFLQDVGVLERLAQVEGQALARAMVPDVPYGLLDGLHTRLGVESRPALPPWLWRDEALRRWGGVRPSRSGLASARGGQPSGRGGAERGPLVQHLSPRRS